MHRFDRRAGHEANRRAARPEPRGIDSLTYIGRESNRLEEVEEQNLFDRSDVYTEYPDPRRDKWATKLLPELREISDREIGEGTGISRAQNATETKARDHTPSTSKPSSASWSDGVVARRKVRQRPGCRVRCSRKYGLGGGHAATLRASHTNPVGARREEPPRRQRRRRPTYYRGVFGLSNLIDSPKLSVEKLLNDPVQLQVPPWQRFYSWTSTEVEEFWYDVTQYASRYRPGGPDYFIGTILIVARDNQARKLLDGQQRLATSVILLSVLRDEVASLIPRDNTLHRLDSQIEETCIRSHDYSTGEDRRRLLLTEQDDAFFERHIIGNDPLATAERRLKPSQVLLLRAKRFCQAKISEEREKRTPDDYKRFIVSLQQCSKKRRRRYRRHDG